MVFTSNPLPGDIYVHLRQSLSVTFIRWKQIDFFFFFFEPVIHTSAPPKKRSRTIQNPLNQTRILAVAVALLLSIRTAGEKKMFMLSLHEIESGWASKDTLRIFQWNSETCECVLQPGVYRPVNGKI